MRILVYLIVDSISTMANIKALDQHISDLNQQRQQLVQELDTFYNHAEAVTKPLLFISTNYLYSTMCNNG